LIKKIRRSLGDYNIEPKVSNESKDVDLFMMALMSEEKEETF